MVIKVVICITWKSFCPTWITNCCRGFKSIWLIFLLNGWSRLIAPRKVNVETWTKTKWIYISIMAIL